MQLSDDYGAAAGLPGRDETFPPDRDSQRCCCCSWPMWGRRLHPACPNLAVVRGRPARRSVARGDRKDPLNPSSKPMN
jgi:hypothetical protein